MFTALDSASPADIHIGRLLFGPFNACIIVLALAIALLSAFALWRVGDREDRQKRLSQALRGHTLRSSDLLWKRRPPWYQQLGTQVASMKIIGTAKQQSLLATLVSAGMDGHGHLSALIAGKVCSGVAFVPLGWLLLEWRRIFAELPTARLLVLAAAFALGWRLPEIILSRLARRRSVRLETGMPDALDLLVICAEAGLSLDHAIEQVGRALRPSSPEVAKEFAATAAEMRVLPMRGQALENLAERVGLASLRSIVVTLNQSIKLGTSLAESLRVLAVAMRSDSLARFEQRAARLPVLLTLPLMVFVLPSLMVVIGTPLVLRIADMLRATL